MARVDELAPSDAALRARISELGLDAMEATIVQSALPALKLVPGANGERSFFGASEAGPTLTSPSGRPLQPLLWVWLAEAASALGQSLDRLSGLAGLPSEGWLVFGAVLDTDLELGEGLPYNDGNAVVVHLPETATATPRSEGFAGAFQAVAFEPIVTVPDPDIAAQALDLPADLVEAYTLLWEPQTDTVPGPMPPPHALHYLFGHAGWHYSSGLPGAGEPELRLLAQIAPDDAVGAPALSGEVAFFVCERDRPLETLSVRIQR